LGPVPFLSSPMAAFLIALVVVATSADAGPRHCPADRRAAEIAAASSAAGRVAGTSGNERDAVRSPSRETGPRDELVLGKEAYARFDNEDALEHYRKAAEGRPDDVEALWRLALACADVGKAREDADRKGAEELYRQGVTAARRAVATSPDTPNAHFVLAVCLGRLALVEGGKTRIRLSKEVKMEAERTIELDPAHDGAYVVLGRWNEAIATLGWFQKAVGGVIYGSLPSGATVAKAAEMFRKAVELDPGRPGHRLEYARALIELGRYSEARKQLRTCLELPRVQWDDPASKAEAARLLKDIEGKRDEG
jgi:tetratricopeptide (TPR) repeat protein